MNDATVSATGVVLNNDFIVDFLEFVGRGIPGYLGGPVFNERGELVAVMREAWNRQGFKGGPTNLVNRAFSIEFLRLSQVPVFDRFNTPLTPSNDSKEKPNISLLDALDFPRTNEAQSKK